MTLREIIPPHTPRYPVKDRFAINLDHFFGLVMIQLRPKDSAKGLDRIQVDTWFKNAHDPIDYASETLRFLDELPEDFEWDIRTDYLLRTSVILLGGGKIEAAHRIASMALDRLLKRDAKATAEHRGIHNPHDKSYAALLVRTTELMLEKEPLHNYKEIRSVLAEWAGSNWEELLSVALAANVIYGYMERFHGLNLSHKKLFPDAPGGDGFFDLIRGKVRERWKSEELEW